MATIKTITPHFVSDNKPATLHFNLWDKFNEFADAQKSKQTLWFFLVLMVHGVIFLPIPAVLSYYFDGSAAVLAITMICFFANLIANMAGAGIRTVLRLFAASFLIHLAMIIIVIV